MLSRKLITFDIMIKIENMLKMLSNRVLHRDTMSTPLPSKMATNTMVFGHYAVNYVLFSSGAPPCKYLTLVSNGF